ncbi:VOC family protein [Kitasatospora phosalacinea]|uniref:VOC family protein n=1 Tax=Kitasatospora phosalacinea TaxID=2065 RepID=UPI0035E0EFA5
MDSVPFGRSQGLPVARLRYATIDIDGLGIDLIQFTDPVGERTNGRANRPGSVHLCFKVDDFDAVHRRMEDAGYDFLGGDCTFIAGEVTPDAALGTRVAYFNDPDGTNLEIIEPREASPTSRDLIPLRGLRRVPYPRRRCIPARLEKAVARLRS